MTSANANRVEPNDIGWMFVPQYYSFLHSEPQRLHCFYTKRSTLIHGTEGEDCQPRYGQQEIHDRIMGLDFQDCRVYVSNVDSQSSAEGGIIVQVLGEISNKQQPWRKFAQTFFLAEQMNGYFVLNDIFRYMKEDDHEEEEVFSSSSSLAPNASSSIPPHRAEQFQHPANGGLNLANMQNPSSSLKSFGMPSPAPSHLLQQQQQFPSQNQPAVSRSPVLSRSPVVEQSHPASQPTHVPIPKPIEPEVTQVNGFHFEEEQDQPVKTDAEQLSTVSPQEEVKPIASPTAEMEKPIESKPESVPSSLDVQENPVSVPTSDPTPKSDPAVPPISKAEENPAPVPPKPVVQSSNTSSSPSASKQKPLPQASENKFTVAPSSQNSSVQGTPTASTSTTSTPAPTPSNAPAAPVTKTWATLAASAKKVAPPASSSSTSSATSSRPAQPTSGVSGSSAPRAASHSLASVPGFNQGGVFDLKTFNSTNCFIRGVLTTLDERELREVISKKFGSVREVDVMKDKACAFVEFLSVDVAKKAIGYCMPQYAGGEGGLYLPKSACMVYIEPKKKPGAPMMMGGESRGGASGGGGQQRNHQVQQQVSNSNVKNAQKVGQQHAAGVEEREVVGGPSSSTGASTPAQQQPQQAAQGGTHKKKSSKSKNQSQPAANQGKA